MQDWMTIRRFKEGDRVRVVGPGAEPHPHASGVVSSIRSISNIYRYDVEFQDGRSETFFAFELRPAAPGSP